MTITAIFVGYGAQFDIWELIRKTELDVKKFDADKYNDENDEWCGDDWLDDNRIDILYELNRILSVVLFQDEKGKDLNLALRVVQLPHDFGNEDEVGVGFFTQLAFGGNIDIDKRYFDEKNKEILNKFELINEKKVSLMSIPNDCQCCS